ncbi:MAG: hypothetical protein ACOCNX_01100 [Prevotella sp.]
MTNVIKSRIYGKQPHDIYTVLFNTDKEQADSVNLTVPTLDDLSAALGDSFIPQSEIVQTLADFESESSVSFSDDAKFNFAKEQVKKAISTYDTSEGVGGVNNFYFEYGGQKFPYWFNAYERTALTSEATQWAKKYGKYRIDARKYGVSFEVSCDTLLDWLGQLKDYAIRCYNKTTDHLLAVDKCTSMEDLVAYDYKAGYPDNLIFSV